MHRVRLIHWNAGEAEERTGRLRSAGYEVVHEMLDPAGLRELDLPLGAARGPRLHSDQRYRKYC